MTRVSRIAVSATIVVALAGATAYVAGGEIVGRFPAQAAVPNAPGGGRAAGAGAGNAQSTGSAPPFGVKTVAAVAGSIAIRRETIGWITATASTNLTSPQQGVMTDIPVGDGASVTKGELVAKLDDRMAAAAVARDKAALARDQATLAGTERTLSQDQALAATGAANRATVDQATTARDVAAAVIDVDNATLSADQLTLANTEIRAPYDGRLGAFQVSVGSLVQPGAAVVALTRMSPVEASFAVPEADLAAVRSALAAGGNAVSVRPRSADATAVTGPLTFVDSTVDRTSGTVKAAATLDNQAMTLWPGQSVDVELTTGTSDNLILIPTVAVRPAQSGSVVDVVGPDQRIAVRPVTVAGMDGATTGVSTGLKPGDHVVVEGQINLVDGTRVAEAGAAQAAAATPTARSRRSTAQE